MAALPPIIASLQAAAPYLTIGAAVANSIQQNQEQSAQIEAQAKAAEYNSQIALRNKELSEQQTESQLQAADRAKRLRMGANIAAMGASGVAGGSALDIMGDNLTQETLDILNIRREGVLRSQSFGIESGMQQASARNLLASRPSTATTVMRGAAAGLGASYKTGVIS